MSFRFGFAHVNAIHAYLAVSLLALGAIGGCDKISRAQADGVVAKQEKRASESCKTISRLPTTITEAGRWCLASDLTFLGEKGDAIRVDVDGVTIDLNGHTLIGSGQTSSLANGIYAGGVEDLVISNGGLKGFHYGVRIDGNGTKRKSSRFLTVKQLTITDSGFRGIALNARQAVISKNTILRTGGTTAYEDASAIGIDAKSALCNINGNSIVETNPVGIGTAAAIHMPIESRLCMVSGNRLSNTQIPLYGRSIGIWFSSPGMNPVARQNELSGFTFPFLSLSKNVFDNRSINNACDVSDMPVYYLKFSMSPQNTYRQDAGLECTESLAVLTKRADVLDPRIQYRLFVAYSDALVPLPKGASRLQEMETALIHLRAAAAGGLTSASETLPSREALLKTMRAEGQK